MEHLPLRSLHSDESLSEAKLEKMRGSATEELLESLLPGRLECLKARPDGMILDGHHRIKVLRERGTNVDTLPREIHEKEDPFK
jgi:ParB-like chromosome segregation protein Spo0J